jgi:hypothetical protein
MCADREEDLNLYRVLQAAKPPPDAKLLSWKYPS